MPSPADCLRLTVRDRVITVLQAITAGSTYNITPAEVLSVWVELEQTKGDTYCVFPNEDGQIEESGANDEYEGDFFLVVMGRVFDNVDPGRKLFQATADIMLAINTDSKSGASGSLGVLVDRTFFPEFPDTDSGYMSTHGFAEFALRVGFRIHGDYGEL